jgi:hypothetical protein
MGKITRLTEKTKICKIIRLFKKTTSIKSATVMKTWCEEDCDKFKRAFEATSVTPLTLDIVVSLITFIRHINVYGCIALVARILSPLANLKLNSPPP